MAWELSPSIISVVAERKILEAMEAGEFDNLPGRGQPQKLEDLSGLPEDLRLAYMVLKNSSYLQASDEPNAEANNEPNVMNITNVRSLLANAPEEDAYFRRLNKLKSRLSARSGQKTIDRLSNSPYLGSILDKIRS
ncbi:MAG: DUF1992 domain-containing protein [Deltaproteobacteria bacterium]|nr:DUF1992 domain-containing protein [Deltaproteobacteria bacterium]